MAPEIGNAFNNDKMYDMKVDSWAVGVTIFTMYDHLSVLRSVYSLLSIQRLAGMTPFEELKPCREDAFPKFIWKVRWYLLPLDLNENGTLVLIIMVLSRSINSSAL